MGRNATNSRDYEMCLAESKQPEAALLKWSGGCGRFEGRSSNLQKGDDTMKRIIGTILAGGLSALTLAAAPAHAEEGAYEHREGVQQEYDRRPPPPERMDYHHQYARERSDEDGYRGDGYRRYDHESRPEQEREERYRHGSVSLGTGDQ
jgi:hypothetical protein